MERSSGGSRGNSAAIQPSPACWADWLDSLLRLYAERILAVDLAVARRWGRLSDTIGHESADLLIAATAIENGLTVVTRNVRHFAPTGVPVLDPSAPPR